MPVKVYFFHPDYTVGHGIAPCHVALRLAGLRFCAYSTITRGLATGWALKRSVICSGLISTHITQHYLINGLSHLFICTIHKTKFIQIQRS